MSAIVQLLPARRFITLLIASIVMVTSAIYGESLPTIPGVIAANNTIAIVAPSDDHNSVTLTLDAGDINLLITVNGETIAYPLAEVQNISYSGGQGGFDNVNVNRLYGSILFTAVFYGGNNHIVMATKRDLITLFGGNNTVDASNGFATVIGEKSASNSFTPAANINDATTANVYDSILPGVCEINGELFVTGGASAGNRITIGRDGSTGGMMVSKNGQSDEIPASYATGEVVYTSSPLGSDQFSLTSTGLLTSVTMYGDGNSCSFDDSFVTANIYGDHDVFSGSIDPSQSPTVNIYFPGSAKPTEQMVSIMTLVANYVPYAPLTGVLIPASGGGTLPGTATIPGVIAANNVVAIIGPLISGNQVSISTDPAAVTLFITVNGQTITFPQAEVSQVTYASGAQGSDQVSVSGLYPFQFFTAVLTGGHTTVTTTAKRAEFMCFGDSNSIDATGGFAVILGAKGLNNSFTPAANVSVAMSSDTYASSLPGVGVVSGEVFINAPLTTGNALSFSRDASSGGLAVSENGVTDVLPAALAAGTIHYSGGMNGGDALTLNLSTVTVDALLYGSGNSCVLQSNLANISFSAPDNAVSGPASGSITIDYTGDSLPAEQISGSLLANTTYVPCGPMTASLSQPNPTATSTSTATSTATGGSSGTSTISTTSTTTSASASASATASGASGASLNPTAIPDSGTSGRGCGVGGSSAVIAMALLVSRRQFRRHRG